MRELHILSAHPPYSTLYINLGDGITAHPLFAIEGKDVYFLFEEALRDVIDAHSMNIGEWKDYFTHNIGLLDFIVPNPSRPQPRIITVAKTPFSETDAVKEAKRDVSIGNTSINMDF